MCTAIIVAIGFLSGAAMAQNWQLQWSDEFDYHGLPDSSKWAPTPHISHYGAEIFCGSRLKNSHVDSGMAWITACKEDTVIRSGRSATTYQYTSAEITTLGKAAFTYGRFEMRARMPYGTGTHTGLWMVPTVDNGPASGEIDIMENVGYEPDRAVFTPHTPNCPQPTPGNSIQGYTDAFAELWNSFHTYALEWNTERLDWYMDTTHVFAYVNPHTGSRNWPFDNSPHFLLITLVIGDEWGGRNGIDTSIFPTSLCVDYVRVYGLDTTMTPTITHIARHSVAAPSSYMTIMLPSIMRGDVFNKNSSSFDMTGRRISHDASVRAFPCAMACPIVIEAPDRNK
jgi:beta-glucanase (GH16 family)